MRLSCPIKFVFSHLMTLGETKTSLLLLNQVVSTSYDSMVCVWDLETGEKVIQFSNCHENCEITAMTFDPTHRRLLTAGKDGSIKIWNFNNGALLGELQVLELFR